MIGHDRCPGSSSGSIAVGSAARSQPNISPCHDSGSSCHPGARRSSGRAPHAAPAADAKPPAEIVPVKGVKERWGTFNLAGHPEYSYNPFDPYHQNTLKADYPMAGDWFIQVNALNTDVYKSRSNLDFRNAIPGLRPFSRTTIFLTRTFSTASSCGTTRTFSCPRTLSFTSTACSTTSRTSTR